MFGHPGVSEQHILLRFGHQATKVRRVELDGVLRDDRGDRPYHRKSNVIMRRGAAGSLYPWRTQQGKPLPARLGSGLRRLNMELKKRFQKTRCLFAKDKISKKMTRLLGTLYKEKCDVFPGEFDPTRFRR